MRLACWSFILVAVLSMPSPPAAASCFDWPAILQANRNRFATDGGAQKILVLSFVNETGNPQLQWLAEAFRLALAMALQPAKGGDVIERPSRETTFLPAEAALLGQAIGADYVIAGQYRMDPGTLKVFTHFVGVQGATSLALNEDAVEWPNPQKLAELVSYLARRASKAFPKIKVDKKRLELTQNAPRSLTAFEHWTLGMLADEKGTLEKIETAHAEFQEAIKNDFNYCHAYLGAAQTAAERGFIARLQGKPYKDQQQKAQRELTKMTLLCPPVAELWHERVTQYLEGDVAYTAGVDLAKQGKTREAIGQLEKGIALLPGDVLARHTLAQLYQQVGAGDKASEQAGAIAELARCR